MAIFSFFFLFIYCYFAFIQFKFCVREKVNEGDKLLSHGMGTFSFCANTHGRTQRGGGGAGGPDPPPGIARLYIFAMLKFSVRPLLGTPPPPTPPTEKNFWIRACTRLLHVFICCGQVAAFLVGLFACVCCAL